MIYVQMISSVRWAVGQDTPFFRKGKTYELDKSVAQAMIDAGVAKKARKPKQDKKSVVKENKAIEHADESKDDDADENGGDVEQEEDSVGEGSGDDAE